MTKCSSGGFAQIILLVAFLLITGGIIYLKVSSIDTVPYQPIVPNKKLASPSAQPATPSSLLKISTPVVQPTKNPPIADQQPQTNGSSNSNNNSQTNNSGNNAGTNSTSPTSQNTNQSSDNNTPPTLPPAISVDHTNVTITLDRTGIQTGDLVYGAGFTITNQTATGWEIKYTDPTSGQGFYESSGGISPGSSATVRSYINTSKPNGTYTGSAIVQYQQNGTWIDGPTVTYSITLVGTAPAPAPPPPPAGCTPVSFTTNQSGSMTTVTITGAWWLTVKATPSQTSEDFDTANHIIYLHFNMPSGTVNVYSAGYSGAPLCQSYSFGS